MFFWCLTTILLTGTAQRSHPVKMLCSTWWKSKNSQNQKFLNFCPDQNFAPDPKVLPNRQNFCSICGKSKISKISATFLDFQKFQNFWLFLVFWQKNQKLLLYFCFFIVFSKIFKSFWFEFLKNPKIAKLLGVTFEKQKFQNFWLNLCFSLKKQRLLLQFLLFPKKQKLLLSIVEPNRVLNP